jgi:urease accessory protein
MRADPSGSLRNPRDQHQSERSAFQWASDRGSIASPLPGEPANAPPCAVDAPVVQPTKCIDAPRTRAVQGTAEASQLAAWQAQLRLDFESRAQHAPGHAREAVTGVAAHATPASALAACGTILARSQHEGPLRVQRPFFPEGRTGPCHVYVLHPPGGVVSGDRLLVDVRLAPQTAVLLTAPGATKLYRARAHNDAALVHRFSVGEGACVEWLPPETIAYDGTQTRVSTHVELAPDATYVGWELLCLGRPAAGERLTHGALHTELTLRRAGKLTYLERGAYRGGDALLGATWGMAGQPVLATMVVATPNVERSWVEAVRESVHGASDGAHADTQAPGSARSCAASPPSLFAVTLVSGVLIARYRGRSTREARALFERAYAVLRPLYAGRDAVHPRIWST